ncbi:MAG: reverse gyrase [Persephonella sp.]|nr:MAG: reverse gyrase [Persephonella sp.]
MCPNCNGDISSDRLEKGLPCVKCLPDEVEKDEVCDFIGYGKFRNVCDVWEELNRFKRFFKEIIKNDLWSIQETWAIRYFLNISYALLAPTGIGKTTFGLILSKFLVENFNKKVYLLFPTQVLVNQAYDKLINYGVNHDKIIAYSSKFAKSKKKQEELKNRIKNGDFNILITTTMFLYKNIDNIPKGIYSLVFVDDVDSILKSAKNIDKVLMLLSFTEEDINKGLEFIKFKQKVFSKKSITEEDLENYRRFQEEIFKISKKRKGVLIVSSATSNPKSKRVNLFRELLGFEVGKPSITLRNVEDVYEEAIDKDLWELSIDKIKRLGKGGLVFLSSSETVENLHRYVEFLNQNGINAISYEKLMDNLDKFKSGEIPVVVGFASYRNPIARGIDLPDVIRYALFIGVPKLQFNIRFEEEFIHLYYFLLTLTPFLVKKKLIDDKEIKTLYEYIRFLKIFAFIPYENLDKEKQERLLKIRDFVKSLVERNDIYDAIKNSPEITLKKVNDSFILITADITGYIQASGRTSRLYAGGLTKGLAYLLVDDEKAFYSLQKKVRFFSEDINFKPINDIDLEKILNEIDKDRERVKKVLAGEIIPEERQSFKTTVVIVESPNKARTIANFFGKPLRRRLKNLDAYEIAIGNRFLTIVASKGHLFDLNKEEGYFGVLKEDKFIPIFEVIDDTRKEIVDSIRELDLEVQEVYVATDPDTEGEKISFDIYLNSKPYNYHIKRAEFHEITKKAFLKAISEFREIDKNLVKAQLVRRISDRWIGFLISQYIQKKLKNPHLSAGRVQTPVLEWIVNRTEEARKKINVVKIFINDYPVEFQFEDKKSAKWFYENIQFVNVKKLESKEEKLFVKPFTTDSLLMSASRELRFSPSETMDLAQDLFEEGLITYHRTDSFRVSDTGIGIAKEYILENFGEEYFHPRKFSNVEGAHECIRPTKAMDSEELKSIQYMIGFQNLTPKHIRLYNLIFKQFIASQMKETIVEKVKYLIKAFKEEIEEYILTKIIEDGYNLILPIKTYSIKEGNIEIGNKVIYQKPKVPYYTFDTVIKDMKEKGIGRPSTYAITVQKLLDRKYIIERKGFLFATKLGKTVLNLVKAREDLYRFVNEEFTKKLEDIMDKIAEGSNDYEKELLSLFNQLWNGDVY